MFFRQSYEIMSYDLKTLQEELKRRHEQAVFDRESAKAAALSAAAQPVSAVPGSTAQPASAAPAPPVVMSTHVNPSNYVCNLEFV